MPQPPATLAPLAVAGAGLLWASAGLIGDGLPLPPVVLAEVRLAGSALALAILIGPRRLLRCLTPLPWSGLLLAALGMGLFQWSFFASVKVGGASFATWVTVVSGPLWVALLAGKGLPWTGTLLGALGIALLMNGAAIPPEALAWSLPTGLAYALYAEATGRAARGDASGAAGGLAVTAVALAGGALGLLPLLPGQIDALPALPWPVAWFGQLVFLGVGSTALAYALFAWGLGHLSAERALSLQWVQPVATELLCAALTPAYQVNPLYLAGAGVLALSMLTRSIAAEPPGSSGLTPSPPRPSP